MLLLSHPPQAQSVESYSASKINTFFTPQRFKSDFTPFNLHLHVCFRSYLLLINFYNSAFSLARSSEVEGCRSNDMSASRPTVEVPEDIPESSSPYLRFKHESNSQESCDVSYVQCERPAALSRILYHRFFSPHSAHLSASDTISDMHCPGRAASAWQDVHSQEAGAILELDWPLYQR